MSNRKEPFSQADALLKALVRLILEDQRMRDPDLTIGDQILILQDSGLKQSLAASILGIPNNQIPSYLRRATNKKLLAKLVKKQVD